MNPSLKQSLWLEAAERATLQAVDGERALTRGWQRYRLRLIVTYAAVMTVMLALTASLFLAHSLAAGADTAPEPSLARTLVSITVHADGASAETGQSVQMDAEGRFSDGSVQPLTDGVRWASSDADIATVDSAGVVRALNPGRITIEATRESIQGRLQFTVLQTASPSLTSISLTPPTVTLGLRQSLQLAAVGTFSDGSSRPVGATGIWRSNNPAVAAVDGGGLVTATGTGSALITLTEDGQTAQAHIDVPVAIVGLRIDPPATELQVGQSQQLKAEFVLNDGNTRLADRAVWSTSNDKVVQVDQNGLAVAVGTSQAPPPVEGQSTDPVGTAATVTVQQDGFTGEASFAVFPQNPPS
ncbi:Ig-like domain-containing protein [Arthrobacter sp. H35-D1]|uniref:Ig-like domain-containing protein n=1 Tax=Arthrobacter sp. H35-D1 TaxID=3046202 RepID=UPI0024BB2ABA|nr:Ig-like domain-containing protein [Arthrobacter sp. H35-D1]MDJ0313088.1 Ig-like domain-containing protein [Arthrobacter sp. H35-D1]